MENSSKLIASKRGRVLLVRRRCDGRWMFPGGRKRAREGDKDCLRREIKEELPKLKVERLQLWYDHKRGKRAFSADVETNGRRHYLEARANDVIEAWQAICARTRRNFGSDFDKDGRLH